MRRRLTRIGNRIGVWLYQRLGGRLSSSRRGAKVLLITVPGRRTGLPRSTCVRFLKVPEGLVVWGTGAGSRNDPDWFRNLRLAYVADVQVGGEHLRMRPRELVGTERETMWHATVLARAPEVARYASRAGRTIPVAVLQPLDGAQP